MGIIFLNLRGGNGKHNWEIQLGEAPGLLPARESKAGMLCHNISIFLVSSGCLIPWKSIEENIHPLPGPVGTGTHTHNNSNQKFQAFKNFDPLERSKMEELLKAMISWERQEFKSGQIEE